MGTYPNMIGDGVFYAKTPSPIALGYVPFTLVYAVHTVQQFCLYIVELLR